MLPDGLAEDDYCYLTTIGRVTGKLHEIEIWFAVEGSALYMLSGGRARADWVKNILHTPEVRVRIRDSELQGLGRVAERAGEDELARKLLFEKYQPRTAGDLTRWRGYALPVAVDLEEAADEIHGR